MDHGIRIPAWGVLFLVAFGLSVIGISVLSLIHCVQHVYASTPDAQAGLTYLFGSN